MIAPPLHQLPSFGQILGMIVGRPDFVAFAVGELALDHVTIESVFVEDGRSRCAEAMRGRLALIAEPVQSAQQALGMHGHRRVLEAGQQERAVALHLTQLLEQGEGLRRQRHQMLGRHLHPVGGNSPQGIGFVEFEPSRVAEFLWPDKREGHQLQSDQGLGVAGVFLKLAEEFRQVSFTQIGVMLGSMARQCSSEVAGDIPLRLAARNGVAKDLAAPLTGSLGGVSRAPLFDCAERHQKIDRFDGLDGRGTENRKEVLFENALDPIAMLVRKVPYPLVNPVAGNRFEIVLDLNLCADLLLLFFKGGIHAIGQLLFRFVAGKPGRFEADYRVGAERQCLALGVEAVVQSPILPALGIDEKVETIAIGGLVWFRAGLKGPAFLIAETHEGISIFVNQNTLKYTLKIHGKTR